MGLPGNFNQSSGNKPRIDLKRCTHSKRATCTSVRLKGVKPGPVVTAIVIGHSALSCLIWLVSPPPKTVTGNYGKYLTKAGGATSSS